MSLLALVAALFLEQWRPLADRRYLFSVMARYALFLEGKFNAGEAQQGTIAWVLAVALPAIAVWVIHAIAWRISPLLALLFSVAVLYLTLGFRQFSHYFTEIHLALKEDDINAARQSLGAWCGRDCTTLDREAIVRLTIEQSIVASHQHVFAVVFWYLVLPGPSGAVLYRLALFLRRRWETNASPEFAQFGQFARRAFALIDWLPVRLTAIAFAVVGDFQDAIDCWTTQAAKWPDPDLGILLASGAGALGVRLGMPFVEEGEIVDRPDLGVGDEADIGFLDSTVGLMWRSLVLWLLLLLLIGVVSLIS